MSTYRETFSLRRMWWIFGISMTVMFSIMLFFGARIYQLEPPIPDAYIGPDQTIVFSGEQIRNGQNIFESMGGMQQGSIWGHGSYLAPDWSADWLHRESIAILDRLAEQEYGQAYDRLNDPEQQYLIATLTQIMRVNQHREQDNTVPLQAVRVAAINEVREWTVSLYGPEQTALSSQIREDHAFPSEVRLSVDEANDLTAFYFWTSWAASTNRPGDTISYTTNWPHEPLVGNTPPPSLFMWTIISILVLLAGIGSLVWFYAKQYDIWRKDMIPEDGVPERNPLLDIKPTPSMRATAKYFWVVVALIGLQVLLGVITAHYQVEGQALFGIPLADLFPYAVTRTWHTQLAVFWIATAWLATGLYVAPLVSGHEPRFQRLGVNVLFVCLLIIVLGSLFGEWLGIQQWFESLRMNFWFGHQGYEYIDLGRFWQWFLFVGLLLWLTLLLRALLPALRQGQNRSLLFMLVVASIAIGLLYGAGFMYGEETTISVMEYWRWWVVHLWVEGVFEVFATTIIALLFVKMGLIRQSTATISVLFATIIFLCAGVLGTFHHLYFSGTPVSVIALGSVFSALEVVPLAVIGFEAYSHARAEDNAVWSTTYKWPFLFFTAVMAWNLIGAGLFGFLINPPLALYYMQGLNTTATHAHAAMFGVYGMLGIGLMLFCLRGLTDPERWQDRWLKWSFWSFNIGLAMMVLFSLLPQGLWQVYHSVRDGYWSARTPEFMHSDIMEGFVWARVPGDLVFAVGVLALMGFVISLYRRRR